MNDWRSTWREGFAPILPTEGLTALAAALESDDPRLVQGNTTVPPPLMCVQDWPCEGGCALGYIGTAIGGGFADVDARGNATNPTAAKVGDVEQFFAKACFDADQKLGEAAACRWFLNWFDDTPRDEMRKELLPEVRRAIEARQEAAELVA